MTFCVAEPVFSDDAEALLLADSTIEQVTQESSWQSYIEAAFGGTTPRSGGSATSNQRISVDLSFDKSFSRNWRLIVADRLDINWPAQPNDQHGINTLKDAYLSWQPNDIQVVDFGRINARYGVAIGYNPTDIFRAGAVRSVVSVDPGSLKKNRLGSIMLRGQTLWPAGSITALFSPKLADHPNDATFNPDFGSTNNTSRWLLSGSYKVTEDMNPQWLVFGGTEQPPQFGLNLTTLVSNAAVAFVEWTGGRSRSQLSRSKGIEDKEVFHNRIATGLTYTTANKLSVTVEYDYNGAALDAASWKALMQQDPLVYRQYRVWTLDAQELPTKQAIFLYTNWADAIIKRLDLNAMVRLNMADHSRLQWIEARYHWDHADLALQWQANHGNLGTEFGSLPQQRAWQAALRYYF